MNEIRTDIDLHDVQGNITKGYSRSGFPYARYVFFGICNAAQGREFVRLVGPLVTTGAPWTKYGDPAQGTAKPEVTTNIAFTFEGLRQLGLSEKSLQGFPEEFTVGMRARSPILGDDGVSSPEHWDKVWHVDQENQSVHVLVSLQSKTKSGLEKRYDQLLDLATAANVYSDPTLSHLYPTSPAAGTGLVVGVNMLGFQEAQALRDQNGNLTDREHFGFADGISDPYFKDSGNHPDYVAGGGKRIRRKDPQTADGWAPLANGEFLLGHLDEAKQYPEAPLPAQLSRNGTFMVWRKLHQNVTKWNDFLATEGAKYGDPELFAAKLVGRWKNGAPITKFSTLESAEQHRAQVLAANQKRFSTELTAEQKEQAKREYYQLKQQLQTFDYADDIEGERCPVGAHVRRSNPRSGLEFGKKAFGSPDALSIRRRILRRGMPYGKVTGPPNSGVIGTDTVDHVPGIDSGEHGLIFVALCASISRQFEFVQQQWINYGNDARLANDRDPLVGNHPDSGGRTVIDYDPKQNRGPYFCTGIPRFVETRGGDYFFVPSLTALESIAAGTVDPT
jgi:Dyp-type peroxidase family